MYLLVALAATSALLAATALATEQRLEEVVVTAELRDTSLLSQPGSTSAITAQQIQQRAAQHLLPHLGRGMGQQHL